MPTAAAGEFLVALVGAERRVQGGDGGVPGLVDVLADHRLVDEQPDRDRDQDGDGGDGGGDLAAQGHSARLSL